MAMSSSGRRTVGQWQRVLSLLREYLIFRGNHLKNVSNDILASSAVSSNGSTTQYGTPAATSAAEFAAQLANNGASVHQATQVAQPSAAAAAPKAAVSEPQPAAALQALALYLEQRRARDGLPTLGYRNAEREVTAQDVVNELRGDGYADLQSWQKAVKTKQTSNVTKPTSQMSRLMTHQTSSAPVTRDSSPIGISGKSSMTRAGSPNILAANSRLRSISPFSIGSTDANCNTQSISNSSTLSSSNQSSILTNHAPTYSTIRIPIKDSPRTQQIHSNSAQLSYSTSVSNNKYTPTYSTIHIPVKRSPSKKSPTHTTRRSSIKNSSHKNKYTDNNILNSSNFNNNSDGAVGTIAGDGSSVRVSEPPESDMQKALRTVNSYIPTSLSHVNLNFLRGSKSTNDGTDEKKAARPKWLDRKRDVISKASIDSRTRHLVQGVSFDNVTVTLRRLEDLCHHLVSFPDTKGAAIKCGGLGRLLRVATHTRDAHVAQQARAALSLMGYAGPVSARGARVLTIDGGGVRGLVAIELLRNLEAVTGKPVHEMFDFICGVSTGAIVAVLVGAHRLPLTECLELYQVLSERIFTQTRVRGATGLVINSSYYDSDEWDTILKEHMGEEALLEAAAMRERSPKMCLVACQGERLSTTAYLFRNYILPYRVASHYSGTSNAKLWEAVRASAAAPGYFSEYQMGEKFLTDGGILVNNPSAIAVHEARQLWPDEGFQTIVSLGTGRCQPLQPDGVGGAVSYNWSDRIRNIVNSATDTEGVHTMLHDLLPGNVYFRFNPHLSEEVSLDEVRPDRISAMMEDTKLYARQNMSKVEEAAASLMKQKTPYHKSRDFIKKSRLLHGWDVEG